MPQVFDLTDPNNGCPIEIVELKGYVIRYKTERYDLLAPIIHNDSRAIHFTKNLMDHFFSKNNTADGFRAYFGVIDESTPDFIKGVHNLILVPTKYFNGIHQDMLGNNDWVIVAKNIVAFTGEPSTVICPPGPPCQGSELDKSNEQE